MKIIETIEGAAENTVVYEDATGARFAVTRPKIVSVRQIIAEIKPSAGPGKPVPEKTVPAEDAASAGNKPDKTPDPSPNAGDAAADTNTPKAGSGAKNVKNENTRKS